MPSTSRSESCRSPRRWWLRDGFPPASNSPWFALIALAILVLATVAIFRWRLRVDSSGIARRRLFGWDLWPWHLFEQGKVLEAEAAGATYVLPEKPFWARTLDLNLLEEADRARVEAIIDRLHVRRAPELPGELALRYDFRKEAVISRGGVLLRDRGVETRFGWKEVQTVRIRRRDERRRDFETLEIVLPDRTVTFSARREKGNLIRSWSATPGSKSPTAAVLAAVIERSIPRERIQIDSWTEAPRTIDQWQARRAILARQARELTRVWWVACAASAALLLFVLTQFRGARSVLMLMLGMSALCISVIFIVLCTASRDHRARLAELESQMPAR